MLSLFISLKGLLKAHSYHIDGPVFRLHYRVTVIILLSASILLSCNQFFGDPIHCMVHSSRLKDVVEKFCWIHSTYTLPSAWNKTVGVEVPYPGVSKYSQGVDKIHHAYYQWVALVLLLQGAFFYLPRYLWKSWENGRMKAYSLNLSEFFVPEEESEKCYKLLANTISTHWGFSRSYLIKYMFCELLTMVNVSGQMGLLNVFLGGVFTRFGIKVMQWMDWDQDFRTDPLIEVFPRMTKCLFHDYGPSGDIQKHDVYCLLPLNVLNEKIFIILWFWMFILCIATGLTLIYRFMMMLLPKLRLSILKNKAPLVSTSDLENLVAYSNLGDFFILYMLSKNMQCKHYCKVLETLSVSVLKNPNTHKRSKSTAFV